MSNIVTAMVQRRRIGSATKKAILMYMADRASDDGTGIWSSKGHIAADTEYTDRTVRRAISEMVEDGILQVSGSRPCKNGHTIEYRINLAAIEAMESTRTSAKLTPDTNAPLTQCHPYPGHSVTPTPDTVSAKPSLEPSKEPPLCSTRARKQKFRIPENWVPNEKCRLYAQSKGLTENEIEEMANEFAAYWYDRDDAASRKSERGWDQCWQGHVRRNAWQFIRNRRAEQRPGMVGSTTATEIADRAARYVDRKAAQRRTDFDA